VLRAQFDMPHVELPKAMKGMEQTWVPREAANEFLGGEEPLGRANGSERVHMARIFCHLLKPREGPNREGFKQENEKRQRNRLTP